MSGGVAGNTGRLAVAGHARGDIVLAIMPSIPVGGMERASIEIFRLLEDHGARVVVTTQEGYGNRVETACRARGLETIPVSVQCEPRMPRGPIGLTRHLWRWGVFLKEIFRAYRATRPDWIYVTNLTYLFYSWPLLALSGCRVLFTLPIPPDEPQGRARAALNRFVWRRLVAPICARIVCNSGFTRDRLLATGARPESVHVIYNVLPSRVGSTGKELPARRPGSLRVTYVGRLAPAKGVRQLFDVALQIVRERDDVEFVFAGDYQWKNSFARDLVDRAQALGLDERIIFLGEVEDVLGLLSESDVHVLFSVKEAFGLVVLEAKSQGVPSVVSPGGALPELVDHRIDGFICRDHSPEALREGIEHYLLNDEARRRAGDAAMKSMERFDRERLGALWSHVLDRDT